MELTTGHLSERGKMTRINIPVKIRDIIEAYQEAYRTRYGKYIKLEEVLYKMAWYGKESVIHRTNEMISEHQNYHNG